MSDIDIIIGRNIRKARKARGMTIAEVADRMHRCNCCDECENRQECAGCHTIDKNAVTESTIGSWQRGERTIAARYLHGLSRILGCSVASLYDEDIDRVSRMHVEGASLPDDLQQIVNYGFTEWDGDIHALIRFMGLYMSLQPRERQEIAGMGLTMYGIARKNRRIRQVPYEISLSYIEHQWRKLLTRED